MELPQLTKRLTHSFVAIAMVIAANECCGTEQTESEAIGRQLVARWSTAIQHIGRASVRFERHEYNRVFESAKFSRGFCAFDGEDRWMVRFVPFKQEELFQANEELPAPRSRSGMKYRREPGNGLCLLATSTSKSLSFDERLLEFIEYPNSPPSALMPENRAATSFWDRLQLNLQRVFEPSVGIPLFIPKALLLDHCDVRTSWETTVGTRVLMTRKSGSEDIVPFEHIDAFFQSGSDTPHVVRILSHETETRFFFDPPRNGDQAEIDDATFELPPQAKCRKMVEGHFK